MTNIFSPKDESKNSERINSTIRSQEIKIKKLENEVNNAKKDK